MFGGLSLDDRAIEKRVGLIVLASDHTSEANYARMVASRRIGVFTSRVPYANPVTAENLKAMQSDLTEGDGSDPAGRGARRGVLLVHFGFRGDRRSGRD